MGKSQVFSAHSYVYSHGYTQIRDRGGHNVPPAGVNRVNSRENAQLLFKLTLGYILCAMISFTANSTM